MKKLLLVGLSLLWWGCASTTPKPDVSTISDDLEEQMLAEITAALAHDYFLAGLHYKNMGRLDSAQFYYDLSYRVSPQSRFLAFELAHLALINNDSSAALQWILAGQNMEGDLNLDEAQIIANTYLENAMMDSARVWYDTIIARWPDNLKSLYEYSMILERAQDYENLARVYSLMIPQMNYPGPFVEKQILLLKFQGDDAKLASFLADVYAAQQDPKIGRDLISLLLKEQKYDEALEVSQQIIAADSNSIETWRLMVRLAIHSNRGAEAVEWQKRIVEQYPEQVQEINRLALLEFQVGMLDSAKTNFVKYLQQVPNDHLSHFYLSNIYNIQGDRKTAVSHAQKAIALQPNALAYRNQLAAIYYLNGEYDPAHKTLDAALKLHPENPLALRFKSMAYIHQAINLESQWPQEQSAEQKLALKVRHLALDWQKKAWQLDTMATDLMFDLAANLERLDSLKPALEIFEKLLLLEPENHRALNYLGYLLVDKDLNIERGAQLIDAALELEPDNLAYLDSKAWALAKQKDYAAARKILEQLVPQATTDFVTYWEHLAYVYQQLGDVERAKPLWENVLKINPHHDLAQKSLQALTP